MVTGGASGIGQAIAHLFASAGCSVGILDFCDEVALQIEVSALEERDVAAVGVGADIADPAAVRAAISTITEALGPIDILINNAGTWVSNPFAGVVARAV